MAFWQTGYAEFHEETGIEGWLDREYVPPKPVYRCERCQLACDTLGLLREHHYKSHPAHRPRLSFRGQECGRARTPILGRSSPNDWEFDDRGTIIINGVTVSAEEARSVLTTETGIILVQLTSDGITLDFEFDVEIAQDSDLDGVEHALRRLITGGELTRSTLQTFLSDCEALATSTRYFHGLANYFYGVLAREKSPESDLWGPSAGNVRYTDRFDDAVSRLSQLDRAPAQAVCGLIAFHYNQFDIALSATQSQRVTLVAQRLSRLLEGAEPDNSGNLFDGATDTSLDGVLCDNETGRILQWCATALSSDSEDVIVDMENALPDVEPMDQLKLRLIAGEYRLRSGDLDGARHHAGELRHTPVAERWQRSIMSRVNGEI